jgi:hypothetical protein
MLNNAKNRESKKLLINLRLGLIGPKLFKTLISLNTVKIAFDVIPTDLTEGSFTQDDLTNYFYDRTGLNFCLFQIFINLQYKRGASYCSKLQPIF